MGMHVQHACRLSELAVLALHACVLQSCPHVKMHAPCRRKRGTREEQQQRAQKRAVNDARRMNSVLDHCSLCFASSLRDKALTLSIARHTYMALPARGVLADGHVIIAPVEHVPSFRAADEDVYEELKNYQKCLIQMFAEQVRDGAYDLLPVRCACMYQCCQPCSRPPRPVVACVGCMSRVVA